MALFPREILLKIGEMACESEGNAYETVTFKKSTTPARLFAAQTPVHGGPCSFESPCNTCSMFARLGIARHTDVVGAGLMTHHDYIKAVLKKHKWNFTHINNLGRFLATIGEYQKYVNYVDVEIGVMPKPRTNDQAFVKVKSIELLSSCTGLEHLDIVFNENCPIIPGYGIGPRPDKGRCLIYHLQGVWAPLRKLRGMKEFTIEWQGEGDDVPVEKTWGLKFVSKLARSWAAAPGKKPKSLKSIGIDQPWNEEQVQPSRRIPRHDWYHLIHSVPQNKLFDWYQGEQPAWEESG